MWLKVKITVVVAKDGMSYGCLVFFLFFLNEVRGTNQVMQYFKSVKSDSLNLKIRSLFFLVLGIDSFFNIENRTFWDNGI